MATKARSRDGGAARRALDLVRGETPGADLHLGDLAVDEDARDLEVRLPGAARAIVRVRDVVAERDALAAHVTGPVMHCQFSMSSMRAISAPSPLRCPIFRMRV